MAWFMRGVQSAIFHYASCAPCTGYSDGRKRRKAAKLARKAREKLQLEQPEAYHHPEPTGTNPYWGEEIAIGPGPPPKRAKRANTGSARGIMSAGTQNSAVSKSESSVDVDRGGDTRLSDDTLENDNWNCKRYQREDEYLWGHDDPPIPIQHTVSGSSVGLPGYQLRRPDTSRSGSYRSVRAPPVNELHPPVVSVPSSSPADNRWMLQPPPKASVMAGKERASNRSRSGSGASSNCASSNVELSLGRQVSTRQIMHKLERGQTPELPSISPMSSYSNLVSGQRHDRCRTPQARPPSSTSSRRKKRRDTAMAAMTRTDTMSTQHSSGDSSDTIVRGPAPPTAAIPDIKVIRVRQSRPMLSTVVSSGSGADDLSPSSACKPRRPTSNYENGLPEQPSPVHHHFNTTQSSDSTPYYMKHGAPLNSSDNSTLNCLQDLVSPRALLNSRFVSAPLVEAKIRLPPSEEDMASRARQDWGTSAFGIEKDWPTDQSADHVRVPFDNFGPPHRDPRLRWSVDF